MRDRDKSNNPTFFFLAFLLLTVLLGRAKPDPDPLQDYCVADTKSPQPFFLNGSPCLDPTLATPAHFSTSLSDPAGSLAIKQFGFNVSITTTDNLPGLNTLGLVAAQFDLAGNGLVAPHSHPRASEVIICLKGSLLVGFVDTSNRLYTQNLKPGDSFVFPKGLIHFIHNRDIVGPAKALSGLNSQSPGTQISSLATFATKPQIPDSVLKKAFQISDSDLAKIRKNLGG